MATTERAAIYTRISDDPMGLERGVARQAEDARRLADARGWRVADVFSDNDISALRGRERPGYRALMAAVDAGRVDRVVVFHTSRLWRNRRERAEGFERLAKARVGLTAVKGPDLDLSNASGRMVAGILGEMDTAESEIKGERVASAALHRAQEGRANGAAAYGWRRVRDTDSRGRVRGFRDEVDEERAAVVREIVDRLLAGTSLKEVTADLNARGLLAPQGKPWRSSSVRKLALRPANVAQRLHHGQVIGDAEWPAIVDRDKHERVVSLLSDPARRTSRAGSRKHLLTYGIGSCGVCGDRLKVSRKGGNELYVCDGRGCVGRRVDRVDELLAMVVDERLSRPDAAGLLSADDEAATVARDRVETLRARLNAAADSFAEGAIDAEQLRRITGALRPDVERAEAEVRRHSGPAADVVDLLAPGMVRERWEALTLDKRRRVLAALGIAVVILPTRQGPRFDPESVRVAWRTGG